AASRVQPCLDLRPSNGARPDQRRRIAGHVDDRRRRSARSASGVEQQIDPPAERGLDGVGIRRRLGAADVRARRGHGSSAADKHTPHRDYSIMLRRTTAATIAMTTRSIRNTARMLVPPSRPAMNGLLAMPTSDALVRTPKPAPCARAGITRPAAL